MTYRISPRDGTVGHELSFSRQCGLAIATLLIATLVLVGCGSLNDDEEERDYWSPFHSQSNWTLDEGSMRVELTGFERGHQPGETSEFELILENRRDQTITLNGCLLLIDQVAVVQHLSNFMIELGPDAVGRRTLTARFDQDLEPQAYGLAVVIGDLGAIVHTVRLGIADDEAGPWLDAGELSCNR